MVVHTEVDKIEYGSITAITLKVMDGDSVIQRCSFDILNEGTVAHLKSIVLPSNNIHQDEICRSFDEIVRHLKLHGITSIEIEGKNTK